MVRLTVLLMSVMVEVEVIEVAISTLVWLKCVLEFIDLAEYNVSALLRQVIDDVDVASTFLLYRYKYASTALFPMAPLLKVLGISGQD